WSVGEFGVLAEFHHRHVGAAGSGEFTVTTQGGAMRVTPRSDARILAYETPSPNPRLWNHGVAFCLPLEKASMDCRSGITELGTDSGAILEQSRHEVLFDLGLA